MNTDIQTSLSVEEQVALLNKVRDILDEVDIDLQMLESDMYQISSYTKMLVDKIVKKTEAMARKR
jgi:uncharacterized protein YoxC